LDLEAWRRANADGNREWSEKIQRFQREVTSNGCEAYKQLYGHCIKRQVPRRAFVAQIRNTGWKNIDKFVFDATASRTTSTYTDRVTGKTATLKYNPFTVQVKETASFDQLRVYLLPKKLNSFQRIPRRNGVFSEGLNDKLNYDLHILAVKGGQRYYFEARNVHEKDSILASLVQISESSLNAKLSKIKRSDPEFLINSIDYIDFLAKDNIRQASNQDRIALRNAVAPAILCDVESAGNVDPALSQP